jgi:quinohemoprotein ethanol dehydrogenase
VWKQEFRGGRPSGALTTAGGLLFQMMNDGTFTAMDAKTGNVVWQFQTGAAGAAGPASTYQIDGEQYIAVATRRFLWAFKLGGTLPPGATARTAEVPVTRELFTGPIQDVSDIEVASNVRDMGVTGSHYMTDEYAFSVYRARVKAGTSVRWTNNGRLAHTVIADDGSWTTGLLNPIQVGVVRFDKPGTYTYICKDHPWAKAQLLVVP